jgi:hypothetical protein
MLDKIEKLKLESCQKEALAIMYEFRNGMFQHFRVVNTNAKQLIDTRWGDANGTV